MKKLLALTALVMIAGCSKPEPEPAPEATAAPAAAATPAEVMAADGKSPVGSYRITDSDGKIYPEVLKADGTYQSTAGGKAAASGKWVQKTPNLYCYTEDGPEPKEVCNDEKVENGVWTSKSPDGKVSKVERVAG